MPLHSRRGDIVVCCVVCKHVGRLAVEQADGKIVTDIGKSAVNAEMQNCDCENAFRYDINGKPYVYYHRLKDVSDFDTYAVMTDCWKEDGNKVNSDIWMFSTEAELLKGDWHPAWRFCDYDDCARHVGFPRDCGPRQAVIRNWNCLQGSNLGDCQKNTKFYVRSCGSVLPLAVSTNLGWTVTFLAIVGVMGYLAIGMTIEHRRTGAKGIAALPHRRFWLGMYGLVRDGLHFSAGHVGLPLGTRAQYSQVSAQAHIAAAVDVPKRTSPKRSRSTASHKKQKQMRSLAGPEDHQPTLSGRSKHRNSEEKRSNTRANKNGASKPRPPDGSDDHERGQGHGEEQSTRQLAERRDASTHSSMARVQVVTL